MGVPTNCHGILSLRSWWFCWVYKRTQANGEAATTSSEAVRGLGKRRRKLVPAEKTLLLTL